MIDQELAANIRTTAKALERDTQTMIAVTDKHRECARFLNLNPLNEGMWPIAVLDSLVRLREQKGERAFLWEIYRMMRNK